MAKKKNEAVKFEDALERLEIIADELSRGDIELDEALAKYEEGAKLLKQCHLALSQAEKKIKLVIKENEEIYKLQDFSDTAIESEEEPSGEEDEEEPAGKKKKPGQNKENPGFLI